MATILRFPGPKSPPVVNEAPATDEDFYEFTKVVAKHLCMFAIDLQYPLAGVDDFSGFFYRALLLHRSDYTRGRLLRILDDDQFFPMIEEKFIRHLHDYHFI